jgi:hypothetical protein
VPEQILQRLQIRARLVRQGRGAVPQVVQPRWGVVVPMFAAAILVTRLLPRWIGWLGLVVGFLAGWLGLLAPASPVIANVSSLGFIGFFVFMLAMGIALLRRRPKAAGPGTDEVTTGDLTRPAD